MNDSRNLFKAIKRRIPRERTSVILAERAVWRVWYALMRYRTRWIYRNLDMPNPPIILSNSFPKSGTNLLRQALSGLCSLGPFLDVGSVLISTFEDHSGRRRTSREILQDIDRLSPGDIATAHLLAEDAIIARVICPEYVNYFIYRDPRDVAISHMHYVYEMRPSHVHHKYYQSLASDIDRLRVSITGAQDKEPPLPDIKSRFLPYIDWLHQDEVLAIRFEDLIRDQERSLGRILDHFMKAGFPLSGDREDALRSMQQSINPSRSRTFRTGKVGGWREYFTPELKDLFKRAAGDLLIELGYEDGFDW